MLNLCESIELHERTRPKHIALIGPDESLSYAAFACRVRQYAAALSQVGVQQGNLVGVALQDTVDHVVLLFALMRLGAVIVPIDWRWTDAEQQRLILHFEIDVVLVDNATTAENMTAVQSPAQSPNFLCIDAQWRAQAQLMIKTPAMIKGDDLPLILSLSSGTTGLPSGPLATHQQYKARLLNQLVTLTFNQHDRYLLATPLYFGGGRAFVLTHLIIGATVVLKPPPFTSQELVQTVAEYEITSLFLVPTLIRRLLRESDALLCPMHRLRVLISSGAPLHANERAQVMERITTSYIEYYASTEGGGISVLSPDEQNRYPDSVGRAAFEVEIQIVDDDHNPVACDDVGEIRYRGPGVAKSFYKDPGLSASQFRNGWFYPGDIGRINEEGILFLLGRSKDLINRGGVNIYPVEIERVISSYSGVDEVAVVPAPSTEFGEKVVAFVVQRDVISIKGLMNHCREQLASYKLPSNIVVVDSLPKNSAGKVKKADLAKRLTEI